MADGEPPAETPEEAPASVTKYKVIGGEASGGIKVRAGEDKESEELPARLSFGAEVECLELKKERLHYKKLTGDGPDEGWVSTKASGKPMMARMVAPSAGPKTVTKVMDGKPRVLCLHGTASSKAIMDVQFGKLFSKWGKQIDHYVLEGTKTVVNKPRSVGAEAIEQMSQFFPGKPMMMYDELTFDSKWWRTYKKPQDTLFGIQQMIKKNGPFDGVLGFSQGANFATMLAGQSYCGTGKPMSFVVLWCPNAPGYKDQMPELFEEPLPVPALIIRGEQEDYDEGVKNYLKGKEVDKQGEEMCSEHVVKMFKDPKVVSHSSNHRPFPPTPEEAEKLVETVIEFIMEKAPSNPVVKG
jgi:hypothetical protein